jgi:5'-methylthioadenosine phosphorylase
MNYARIGIIGGSGLYGMAGLEKQREVSVETPYGPPSDAFLLGEMGGVPVAFLARHGRGHRILPSELNFRGNLWAFKKLGVERIIAVSAVGSLKLEHRPLDIVMPDQFFDRTRGRISTFFGEGLVAHIAFAEPVCPDMVQKIASAAARIGITVKKGGTYLCMEGPAFSTKAESHVYRSWGMDVIGMTNLQEAKLAREAEICYATLAMVTDYDCWHTEEESVTIDMLLANLHKNAENAQNIVREAVRDLAQATVCACGSALQTALLTDLNIVPAETKKKLEPILGKYLSKG